MKGMLWAVLSPNEEMYLAWLDNQRIVGKRDLQRCKRITTMLHVYQAQHSGVEIITLVDWREAWNPSQLLEIKRRLEIK